MPSQIVQFSTQKTNSDVPGVNDIDPKEVLEKKSQLVIIDVRRPDEFVGELGHISGALHLVLDSLPQRIDEVPKDKTVVFVCLSGGRSARACAFAADQGLTHVFNMKGGMKAWNQLGFDVEGRSGN
jgi:rhodanese-related sulfurtransferase